MDKLSTFISGTKILEEINSPLNGKIEVIRSFAFGTYIKIGGLTQSGGVVRDVWKTTLKKVKKLKNKEIKNCLILGLGAGSAAELVRELWPKASITGIELDPVMIELGKKYFKLSELKVKIHQGDAIELTTAHTTQSNKRFDLILTDTYCGDNFPKQFESDDFLKLILKSLSPGGVAVFNRLYYGEKRTQAVKFMHKLEKYFDEVNPVYPEANVMFVCRI
jgi:spermidine synthase